MNIKYLVVLLIILFTSCEDQRCAPGTFENLFLSEEANSFFIYDGIEKAIFMDVDSNEIEFTVMHSEIERENTIKSFDCGGGATGMSFERELREITLTGSEVGEHIFKFELTTSFHSKETNFDENHLVDIMKTTHIKRNEFGGGATIILPLIISNRGGLVDIDLANENFNKIENFELHGKSFGQVFERNSLTKPFYYNKEQGIVALYSNSDKWLVLDRFE